MPEGGSAVETGILQYVARGIRSATNYFFGPELPQPLSSPPGTPPRTLDYPTAYNLQIQPRNLEAISFQQMRHIADSFDLVRLCVETRKDQIARLQWRFTATRKPGEKQAAYEARIEKDDRLKELTDFFQSPDQEHSWIDWVRLLLEDMLVIDAPCAAPVTDANGTLWTPGKKLYGLEVTDGATITRKIDTQGRTPSPNLPPPANVAYQQIIKGIPAVNFTRDQLIYKPRNIRAHKFFGFSPVEQIILTINIGLRKQLYLLNYYTEGNVPEAIAQAPESWSADQISEFQEWFDSALAGNLAKRRRITFVPQCGQVQFTRDPQLKDALDEWLARVICYAFSLSPQPFIPQMNRATAQTAQDTATKEGEMPLRLWLTDFVNLAVRRYFGYKDVEFSFEDEKDEDPNVESEIIDRYLKNGTMNLDQACERLGLEPLPNGAGSRHLIYLATGPVPVDTAIENADNPPEPAVQQVGPDGKPVPAAADEGRKPPKGEKKPKKVWRGYEKSNLHSSRK